MKIGQGKVIFYSIVLMILSLVAFLIIKNINDNKVVANIRNIDGTYNGVEYVDSYFKYEKLVYIGRNANNNSNVENGWVYLVKGDEDKNFIYIYNGDNSFYYVKKGYEIPTSGKVTAVFYNYSNKINKESEVDAFVKVATMEGKKYKLTLKNMYDTTKTRNFYFAYNNCPVATNCIGAIAYVEGRWFFIKSEEIRNNNKNQATDRADYLFVGEGTEITDEEIINTIIKSGFIEKPKS